MKGRIVDRMECRCGAAVQVDEITIPGAVQGCLDLARVAFRQLHSEPGCTEWIPYAPPDG